MKTTLQVRVIPNSSRNEIVGWLVDALKIKVQAPPEDGKANRVVCELLQKALGLGAKEVELTRGQASQNKVFTLAIRESALKQKLPS